MERKKNIILYVTLFLIVMYIVGIIGHSIESLRPIMFFLTPFTLLLTGGIVLFVEVLHNEKKMISWFLLAYLFTFIIEAIGTETGYIFGRYVYGSTLGVKLFNVPLIIGFNWVLVIIGGINIAKRFVKNELLIAFITGLLAVMFDFLLEPVAVMFDYWTWENNIIPIQNYIAWFVISFILSYTLLKVKLEIRTVLPANYFIIQTLFFFLIRVTV